MASIADVIQYGVNGVALGSVIALAAIGLTLIYGILNLANFAHGDLLAVGAYGAFFFSVSVPPVEAAFWALGLAVVLAAVGVAGLLAPPTRGRSAGSWRAGLLEPSEARAAVVGAAALAAAVLGLSLPARGLALPALAGALALGAAALVVARRRTARGRGSDVAWALGGGGTALAAWALASPFFLAAALGAAAAVVVAVLFEAVVWRPLRARRATILTLLIVSIGVAFIVRNAIAIRFGSDFLNYARPLELPWRVGPAIFTVDQATTLVVAAAAIAGVHAFLAFTRTGKALRALADNPDLARLSGMDVNRLVVALWILAAGLAGLAGALLPLNNFAVSPGVGFTLLLTLFAAVILGGIGSAYGAMAGGLVIGVVMELVAGLASPDYKFAASFAVLILVLLVRPQGILGGRAT
ncbi:MAG TPA: hypothetical protein VM889_07925 [Candidatus Thermoplasmatota archaeon]|nr:hypothetical protein [Candidatus Thermoplasmatota archaeon]